MINYLSFYFIYLHAGREYSGLDAWRSKDTLHKLGLSVLMCIFEIEFRLGCKCLWLPSHLTRPHIVLSFAVILVCS